MCTLVIMRRPGHAWPLIIAANRDEMVGRPWLPPARHWPDRAEVVAGLDETAGGTWLGVNDFGVVAAVLNRRNSLGPRDGLRSRGELPLEALDHEDAASAAQALAHISPSAYRSFNLVIADAGRAYLLCLRFGGDARGKLPPVEVQEIPAGVSMVTASDLNDVSSPRIRAFLPRFQAAAPPDPASGDWAEWKALLASRVRDAESPPEAAMNIVTPTGFGTVCSSLIGLAAADSEPSGLVWEFASGRPDENEFEMIEF
ncbi:MAG: NRDE family protein [Rhodospirillales bacterium]|nr:NRDE family protein [Rhodospirillales bacterium]